MTTNSARHGHLVLRLATVLALAWLGAGSSVAQAQDLPTLRSPVNDLANVLAPDVEQALDARIRALLTATGDTVVVATVRTYQPFGSIEEYATKLFARAGIGDREKDMGLLVVLAVDDRAVRVEVGYGLEEIITDGYSGETIRRAMLPAFREGRYGDGLLAGATRLIQHIADARGATLAGVPRENRERSPGPRFSLPLIPTIFIIFLLVKLLSSFFGGRGPRGGGRGGWHGGIGPFGGGFGGFGGGFGGGWGGGFGGGGGHGGGGGFGGFGGGMSGGGGASGRW